MRPERLKGARWLSCERANFLLLLLERAVVVVVVGSRELMR